MSSLRDLSKFLFMSMTGPKVAQRIQVVSILLHYAKLCWDDFAFIWTQLVEVVMCKSVVLKRGVGTPFALWKNALERFALEWSRNQQVSLWQRVKSGVHIVDWIRKTGQRRSSAESSAKQQILDNRRKIVNLNYRNCYLLQQTRNSFERTAVRFLSWKQNQEIWTMETFEPWFDIEANTMKSSKTALRLPAAMLNISAQEYKMKS